MFGLGGNLGNGQKKTFFFWQSSLREDWGEPGGVGGVEVIQGGEVGGDEMEGGQYAPEGRFFKNNS